MQDCWNSGINCGEETMVKVIPIVEKQQKGELEQIIMRFLEEEFEEYSFLYNKFCECKEPLNKEDWMTNRIAKIYSGE